MSQKKEFYTKALNEIGKKVLYERVGKLKDIVNMRDSGEDVSKLLEEVNMLEINEDSSIQDDDKLHTGGAKQNNAEGHDPTNVNTETPTSNNIIM